MKEMTEKISGNIMEIPLGDIHFNEDFNCRYQNILPINVKELMESIRDNGLIQPVVVAPYSAHQREETGKKYLLIAGYRRYKATLLLGWPAIKSIVSENLQDVEKARIFNLSENLQRQDLNILEEALALKHLKEEGYDQFYVADKLKKSRGWVQIRFMLLDLPKEVQFDAALGHLTDMNIRDLVTVMRKRGKDGVFGAIKKLKTAKRNNEKVMLVKRKPSPHKKRCRNKPEIGAMQDIMMTIFGPSLATRALAWAGGHISDLEMHSSVQVYAEKIGKEYPLPYEPGQLD